MIEITNCDFIIGGMTKKNSQCWHDEARPFQSDLLQIFFAFLAVDWKHPPPPPPFFFSGVGEGLALARRGEGDGKGDGVGSAVGVGLAVNTLSGAGSIARRERASASPATNIAATITASICKRFLDFALPLTETVILGK